MPRPRDLTDLLTELADSARDVPDMPVSRAVDPARQRPLRLVLLTAGLLAAVLIAATVMNGPRLGPVPAHPATGPTRAVPSIGLPTPGGSPGLTAGSSTPAPSAGAAAPATPTSRSELTVRPMTESEIATRT